MISDQQVAAAADQEFAKFVGMVKQKDAILTSSESSQAAATVGTVNRVSAKIVDAAGMRGRYNWQTVVVKSREANAFVTPNGKIVVFTGILPIAKTEAGLAAVLGHEVSHVIARHSAERMSQVLLAQVTVATVDAALAASNSKYRPAIGAALGLGAQYGVLLPFSRTHESEADHIGLLLMAKAGYDPAEAVGLWQRMEASGRSGPWEFMSSHPSPATRVVQIRGWLPEANLYYADSSRSLPSSLDELQAATAERASRRALAPIVPMPSYSSGFWYQYKASDSETLTTYRFLKQETCQAGECYVVESGPGRTATVTTGLGLVESRDSTGAWRRFTPPLQEFKWPLQVGDSWTDMVAVEESSGRKQTVQMKAEVVSYESVVVPAGTFMAYKIVTALGGRRYREVWYAPETKTVVKSITPTSQGRPIVRELTDYQKGQESADLTKMPPGRTPESLAPGVVRTRPGPLKPGTKEVPMCAWGEYLSSASGQCTKIGQ
ncbi:MAG: M48 family metallopeptidase [Candidatus Rokubacteria bacterium]|nr:M48 family metallopeptidase [Candidatus Rokubacteria bacterium]